VAQSIEPNIADLANGWLKSYKLDYKLEQESLNSEIDKALSDYFTKNGGTGANRPDAKLLLQDKSLDFFPILIEYKGYKDKLVKLDKEGQVENRTTKNEPHFKNINSFAVNGAVHYANALLHHTSYTDVIAVGMTGYKNDSGEINYEIGVYYVSKSNLGSGQKIGDYSDFSFLAPKNFDAFIEKVKTLQLTQEELDRLKEQREREIDQSLVKLNNDIYQNEKGLGENDRVYLVAASIIATLGIPGKVSPLEKADLKSSTEKGYSDGELIIKKIKSFLSHKKLPDEKRQLIVRTLSNTLLTSNINSIENGESQLKRVFTKIVDDLGIYYKIGLTTDFTGKLFNEMYGWLGFTQDKLNDVVLTPSYIASLLVKLARVNKDSYVWDFATGSAGLLVAAMNEMLNDAKNTVQSPDELAQKEIAIKTEQLLGLELISSVYMLAILNMILMGDGSSNILNTDSIKDFDGKYGFGKPDTKFPADAFILNPPYSAPGNGMVFVEKALGMMNKGYAAIIIQNSSGSGKAADYNKKILAKHTLLASIKMPADIFIGKSSVQTAIYVFKINEKHHKDEMVKFIDFTNDGYSRANRRKSSNNLKDTNHAKERYEELVNIVRFGKSKLNIFTEQEYYENTIDPNDGADWNQTAPLDRIPRLNNIKESVINHLSWELITLIKDGVDDHPKERAALKKQLEKIKWGEFKYTEIFKSITIKNKLVKSNLDIAGNIPVYSSESTNNGIVGYTNMAADYAVDKDNPVYVVFGDHTRSFNIATSDFCVMDNVKVLSVSKKCSTKALLFIVSAWKKCIPNLGYSRHWSKAKSIGFNLPIDKDGNIDFGFIEKYVADIERVHLKIIKRYLESHD